MVEQASNTSEALTEIRPLSHDDFFTGTFQKKRLAKAFLRILLPDELIERLDLDGLTAEPRHITDELFKRLIADVIYRVPVKNTDKHVDFFVITEHKSYNDFLTIFQLWCYVLHVVRQEFKTADDAGNVNADYRLPPVIAIILHHGESKFSGKTELSDLFLQLPGIEKYLPKMQAILVDLNTMEDNDVANDPDAPELKLVLMALKLIFRKDAGTKLTAILEESKSISEDPVFQDVVRMVWYYFAASARHMEHDYEILYDTIKTLVEVESMPTMLEKWTAERKDAWIAEGQVETGRDMVSDVLRMRFENVPKEVEQTIRTMTDPATLKSLLVQAIQSKTIDEFADGLR